MNKVFLMGRLTRDPEVRHTQGESPLAIARFSLAIDRKFRQAEGQPAADFINCIAFGRQGEFVEKYLRKGVKIALTGRIQTGSYTNKDGVKVFTTDVVAEDFEFCEGKSSNSNSANDNGFAGAIGGGAGEAFMNIPDGIDEALPFN